MLRLTLHWSKLFLFFWPSSVLLWPSCFCCAPHLVFYGAVFFLRWFVFVFVCISAARYLSDVLSQKDAWKYSSRESLYGIQKEAGVSALAPRGSRTRWEKALIVLSFLNWRLWIQIDWCWIRILNFGQVWFRIRELRYQFQSPNPSWKRTWEEWASQGREARGSCASSRCAYCNMSCNFRDPKPGPGPEFSRLGRTAGTRIREG